MEERAACAQLKRRFEAAGFRIKENQTFDEDGVWFEMDGFDAERRVGYEYVTAEAGDGWDVDGEVIAALAERRRRGELHVLIIDEEDAPDAASLDTAIDEFLAALPAREAAAAAAAAAPAAVEAAEAAEAIDVDVAESDDIAEADDAAESEDATQPLDVDDIEPAAAEPRKPPPPPAAAKSGAKAAASASKPAKSGAKSTRPPPTPKAAKKKPARKPK